MVKWFGDSKTDTSQDAEIKKIYQWIDVLNKNQQTILKNQKVLIQNNDYFIKTIQQLLAKDKEHDSRDVEHDKLLEGLKNLTKQIETAT